MWIFELFGVFLGLGLFAILLLFFGFIQILQAVLAVLFFILVLPFILVGTFIGSILRQIR